jgi:4'-phosphopantetheinyl transferase
LTDLEHGLLKGSIPESEQLKRFFWMWTLKEAYTKALGLGLGFDFKRIEFDVVERIVRVDGKVPEGWRFNKFVINDDEDQYQGVVAEYHGGIQTEVITEADNSPWMNKYDAVPFTEEAIAQVIERGMVQKD